MQTQRHDIPEQPFDAVAQAEAGISRLRQLSVKLAMAELEIELFDVMEPLEEEWRRLERDDLSSLHQSYDWCSAWVAAFRRPLTILRGRCGTHTAFILPVEIIRSRGMRIAKFIGADHSNINTGLFSQAFAEDSDSLDGHHLAARLRAALAGKADLLLLQNIPLEWRDRRNMLAGLPMVQNQNHAYQLPLFDTFDKTLQQLNAKSRRKKFRVQSGGWRRLAASTISYRKRPRSNTNCSTRSSA